MNRRLSFPAWGLAALLMLSALANVFLVFQQTLLQRELKELDRQLAHPELPQVEAMIRNLVADLVIYGQKQPAIFEVLKKYGVAGSSSPHPPSAAPVRTKKSP